jgi:hypothetical protein
MVVPKETIFKLVVQLVIAGLRFTNNIYQYHICADVFVLLQHGTFKREVPKVLHESHHTQVPFNLTIKQEVNFNFELEPYKHIS